MGSRRAVALFLVVWFGTGVAAGQPKRRATKPAKENAEKAVEAPAADKTAKPEAADKAKAAEAEAAAPEEAAEGDLGSAPPPAAAESGAAKLSPLNPEADEFPAAPPPPAPGELDRILGDIAALRSRVAALTTTLFKSRVRVVVETRGEDARLGALGVTLDDGVVFSAPERFSADDERIVYEHAVAPGQHVLGVEIERYDARNREYRTWQSAKFSLLVPENQLVEAHFVIEDDSDMAVDFPDDGDGEYDARVRLRARVTE